MIHGSGHHLSVIEEEDGRVMSRLKTDLPRFVFFREEKFAPSFEQESFKNTAWESGHSVTHITIFVTFN